MTSNVPEQSPQSRFPRSPRSRQAKSWPLVAATLVPLLGGTGCEAILHIGRAGQNGFDGGAAGTPGAGRDGGGLDGAGGAATDGPVSTTHPPLTSASKLDLMFVIDDSASMAPLQAKMRARLPEFMNVLKSLPGGLPDLHVAIASTSLGAGVFSNIPGCAPATAGNQDGKFQHRAACTQLNAGATFIASKPNGDGTRTVNFDGDINTLFSCMADLGDGGCGFEHPFESARLALQRASTDGDENSGFLRPDAYLAVVMLTNEDDCSVPFDSRLFDVSQQSVNDPLGGLKSYRCNEFGHLCGGQPPPHLPPASPVTLVNCGSNENGSLVTVGGFTDFLFALKPGHPERVFLGAIAGPPAPYVVEGVATQLATGTVETQPLVQHSCTASPSSNGSEYADPAVRIKQATGAFGPNGLFASICADDFGPTMSAIAQKIVAGQ